jgi:hypothetical protein
MNEAQLVIATLHAAGAITDEQRDAATAYLWSCEEDPDGLEAILGRTIAESEREKTAAVGSGA